MWQDKRNNVTTQHVTLLYTLEFQFQDFYSYIAREITYFYTISCLGMEKEGKEGKIHRIFLCLFDHNPLLCLLATFRSV